MTHIVEIKIPKAGQKWNHVLVLEINQWLVDNTGLVDVWWKGSSARDALYSDIMVLKFKDEHDAVAFKLKYVCDR